ncbi:MULTISPECIES: radical SAM protein [unclassified Flavobacterium]|uniref:radical SAM protein n=1 Tax=unclassified Flavobacterium TaxID=196869 RepID=UPI00069BAAA1|nr:radical SAM protein [Flavobacterium sp. ABG]
MANTTENLKCRFAVVKVASRCNLNCTYCYVYNQGDKTYLTQPKVMSPNVVKDLIYRIKEHCLQHGIKKFTFIIHGGEPLLAPQSFYENLITVSEQILKDTDIKLRFSMQTNGVLLTKEWCDLFNRLNISIGISIDGPEIYNDMFRIYHSGKGSYKDIVKGIELANVHLERPVGVLSVINIDIEPEMLYDMYISLNVSSVDILLPDGNYENIPEKLAIDLENNSTLHADWMIKIFDLWFNDTTNDLKIGYFERIMLSILGYDVSADSMGNKNTDVLVIETNGDIESLDVLKICGDGFTKGDANVSLTSFDEALQTPLAKIYQLSHKILSPVCKKCKVKEICGGGYLPHRFSHDKGFDNPSIYCDSLMKLIVHIQNSIISNLPEDVIQDTMITKLEYNNVTSIS